MTVYTSTQIDRLIDRYVNDCGGECTELQEGVLGHGLVLLHGAPGYTAIVVREVFLSEWSSGHTVRRYKEIPKKYQALLDAHTYDPA